MTPEARPDTAALTGPAPRLDRRRWIAQAGIVEIAVAGRVAAAAYVEAVTRRCVVPRVAMRAVGQPDAAAVSELLWGEAFELFHVAGAWALGRSTADDYVGWVPVAALGEPSGAAAFTVTARLAPVFAAASIKAPVLVELPHGARLAGAADGAFVTLAGGGFVHRRHVEAPPADRFAAAALFLGAPYLWGGRTPLGADCSGLAQAALAAEGVALPRDSDQQRDDARGAVVPFEDRARGDLVFFPGHVGLLTAPDTLLHANAHWMACVEEPLADVIGRLEAAGVAEAVTGVRRF